MSESTTIAITGKELIESFINAGIVPPGTDSLRIETSLSDNAVVIETQQFILQNDVRKLGAILRSLSSTLGD